MDQVMQGSPTIKEIVELRYNYIPALQDGRECYSEEYKTAKLDEDGVISIEEHPAMGEGDKWYYTIYHKDGTEIVTFAPYMVIRKPVGSTL